MSLTEIALTLSLVALGQSSEDPGVIRGRVVNLSQREAPCAGAEVILRARIEGQFAPVAETLADAEGNYRFEDLPVGPEYLYLPGANRAEVHYPGRRVGLTRGHPAAYVTLEVRDTVAEPSPLVIRQHEIAIATEPGAVHVAEDLLVDNPTSATYVGRARTEGMLPVTMRLNIPADFTRITFEKEMFGRQFQVIDGKLVTGLPWLPGQRWLRFTYTVPAAAIRGVWQRALDAPCESIRVRIKRSRPEEIACGLPAVADGPPGESIFQFSAGVLPAGHVIRVQLGGTALPWTASARWAALFVLAGLIAGTAIVLWQHHRSPPATTDDLTIGQEGLLPPVSSEAPKSRSRRRQQRRRAA